MMNSVATVILHLPTTDCLCACVFAVFFFLADPSGPRETEFLGDVSGAPSEREHRFSLFRQYSSETSAPPKEVGGSGIKTTAVRKSGAACRGSLCTSLRSRRTVRRSAFVTRLAGCLKARNHLIASFRNVAVAYARLVEIHLMVTRMLCVVVADACVFLLINSGHRGPLLSPAPPASRNVRFLLTPPPPPLPPDRCICATR